MQREYEIPLCKIHPLAKFVKYLYSEHYEPLLEWLN